jgi:hypothetical protein
LNEPPSHASSASGLYWDGTFSEVHATADRHSESGLSSLAQLNAASSPIFPRSPLSPGNVSSPPFSTSSSSSSHSAQSSLLVSASVCTPDSSSNANNSTNNSSTNNGSTSNSDHSLSQHPNGHPATTGVSTGSSVTTPAASCATSLMVLSPMDADAGHGHGSFQDVGSGEQSPGVDSPNTQVRLHMRT